ANTTGFENVALGDSALVANTTGIGNVGVGLNAGEAVNTSNFNTLVGYQAGSQVTGHSNILLGASAVTPNNLTSGSGNVGVGNELFFASTTGNNQLNIGGLLFGTLPATSTAFNPSPVGALGVATSSPYATLSIANNASSTNKSVFAVASTSN